MSPVTLGVKCTPRNGNLGSGTGYTLVVQRCRLLSFKRRYSPRNGTILGLRSQPVITARRSECNPAQVSTYFVGMHFKRKIKSKWYRYNAMVRCNKNVSLKTKAYSIFRLNRDGSQLTFSFRFRHFCESDYFEIEENFTSHFFKVFGESFTYNCPIYYTCPR